MNLIPSTITSLLALFSGFPGIRAFRLQSLEHEQVKMKFLFVTKPTDNHTCNIYIQYPLQNMTKICWLLLLIIQHPNQFITTTLHDKGMFKPHNQH
jgi:hypothetical protein